MLTRLRGGGGRRRQAPQRIVADHRQPAAQDDCDHCRAAANRAAFLPDSPRIRSGDQRNGQLADARYEAPSKRKAYDEKDGVCELQHTEFRKINLRWKGVVCE